MNVNRKTFNRNLALLLIIVGNTLILTMNIQVASARDEEKLKACRQRVDAIYNASEAQQIKWLGIQEENIEKHTRERKATITRQIVALGKVTPRSERHNMEILKKMVSLNDEAIEANRQETEAIRTVTKQKENNMLRFEKVRQAGHTGCNRNYG